MKTEKTGKVNFQATFAALREVLREYEDRLTVLQDQRGNYGLNAGYSEKWKKDTFFGAVQINKSYVSLHLMPVYVFPDLLNAVPEGLRKRMQGKSCFNFKTLGPSHLREVSSLTRRCFERFRKEGLITPSR